MSIFGTIKDAIFGHHVEAAQAAAPSPAPAAVSAPAAAPTPAAAAAQAPVDVDAVLHDIWVKKGSPASN